MTGILYKIVYFGLYFITIVLLLMNLHEIQMSVMWQIECFVPIYNAVNDARTMDNSGKFMLNCSLECIRLVQFYIWCKLYIKMFNKMLEFCLNTNVV